MITKKTLKLRENLKLRDSIRLDENNSLSFNNNILLKNFMTKEKLLENQLMSNPLNELHFIKFNDPENKKQ